MTLSQFIEATKHYPADTEIAVAGGLSSLKAIESGDLTASDNHKHAAKVWSIASTADAIILEL